MVLYPDNVNREDRAKELLLQCGQFQTQMAQAKDTLEAAALAANDAIYKAYKAVEPKTPDLVDWNQRLQVTDMEISDIKDFNWTMNIGGAVASLFAGAKVYKLLKPMLQSANCFKQTGKAVTETVEKELAEGATEEAAAAAADKLATSAAEDILKAGEVAVTETSVSLTGKVVSTVLSGLGGLVAGAVVSVLVDLITESITGAAERDNLRTTIKDAHDMRVQLKLLDMKYEQLKEELMATVNAFDVLLSSGLISSQNEETLNKVVENLVDQHASKLSSITEDAAKKELADLDTLMKSWTDEDTLGA